MKIKKLLAVLLVVALVAASAVLLTACNDGNKGHGDENPSGYMVAMITDYGDITDQSFNQTTYEACKDFCGKFSIPFKYYKPTGDSTEARVASVNTAIAEGYNIIVMPGFAFAGTVDAVADKNKDVKFVALDVALGDLLAAHFPNYDYNPANPAWAEYKLPSNVTTFVYQEELSGYMAGYAAVQEGYKKLGFLGGMAVPAVIRFGYGFVQGANDAAVELQIADQVSVEYVYGGQFYGDADITAVMDTWYGTKGVEVVFACGGGIYTSACEAATKSGISGKVIGVDSDQSYAINKYKAGLCVTSAMKGLAPTVRTVLANTIAGNWSVYSGVINNMGLISNDPTVNYVQLPLDTWSMTNFTKDEYKTLVNKLYEGTITVSNSTSDKPQTTISVVYAANIK